MKYMLLLCILATSLNICARSIHRPKPKDFPYITTQWKHSGPIHRFEESHLGEYALFHIFDSSFFNKYLLPHNLISYHNKPNQSVLGSTLNNLIELLLKEISNGKTEYKHFIVLQKKDFNHKKGWGLLIVKFKQYPFVVKLFIETPESFIHPFDKGIEPSFCFFLGDGIGRHMTGFTRIKNLKNINAKLKKNSKLSLQVVTPRKWYWLPKKRNYIRITGHNIGTHKKQFTDIPATYAIIADEIIFERKLSILNSKDRKNALDLCNYLELCVDPHIKNFMYEKDTGKFALIDTEHFPTLVGFKRKRVFNSYTSWYVNLSSKCIQNMYLRTKRERKLAQYASPPKTRLR